MYTGEIVSRRCAALVLALLIAATSAINAMCEGDCDPPPTASSSCHTSVPSPDGASLRGTPHACDHNHAGGSPALLTGAGSRDSIGAPLIASPPMLAHSRLLEPHSVSGGAMHGPPGLTGRGTSSYVTVLRI